MKILIAGLGSIGRRHLRNLLTLGEQDILLYRTHQATMPDEELQAFPVYSSLKKALLEKPDAVIVSNPTALHLDVAIPAARAGCHLFLEKPVSHSLEGIDSLQTIVNISGVRVVVGYQFRFHPGLKTVKQLLSEAVIGDLVSVQAHWGEYLPDWHPWEDFRVGYAARADLGGGVIRTLCHPLDYLRWLVGEVGSVYCTSSRRHTLGLQVEDSAHISLEFQNGVIGQVHLDYLQRPPEHSLKLIGSSGTILWNNTEGTASCYLAQDPSWKHYPVPEGFERNSMFLAQMKNFLAVVRGEQEPVCSLQDGIEALKIVQASYQSAESAHRVDLAPAG